MALGLLVEYIYGNMNLAKMHISVFVADKGQRSWEDATNSIGDVVSTTLCRLLKHECQLLNLPNSDAKYRLKLLDDRRSFAHYFKIKFSLK